MSSNELDIEMGHSSDKERERAVKLIVALTGVDPIILHKMTKDQLIERLSFILKYEKEKVEMLLREHDQNQELDSVSLQILWKLVSEHVVKPNKKKFGSISNETYDHLKYLMAALIKAVIFKNSNELTIHSSAKLLPQVSESMNKIKGDTILDKWVNITSMGKILEEMSESGKNKSL